MVIETEIQSTEIIDSVLPPAGLVYDGSPSLTDFVSAKTPESLGTQPTPQMLSDRLFYSFDYSQGYQAIQYEIFLYLQNEHPDWKIDNELARQAVNLTVPRVQSFLRHSIAQRDSSKSKRLSGQHNHQPVLQGEEYDINTHISDKMDQMRRAWVNPIPREDVISNLVIGMTLQEYRIFCQQPPFRRQRAGLSPHTPRGDEFFSYLAHYALMEKPTPIPEFTKMFGEIGARMKARDLDPDLAQVLNRVFDIYNKNHDQQVDINFLANPQI